MCNSNCEGLNEPKNCHCDFRVGFYQRQGKHFVTDVNKGGEKNTLRAVSECYGKPLRIIYDSGRSGPDNKHACQRRVFG